MSEAMLVNALVVLLVAALAVAVVVLVKVLLVVTLVMLEAVWVKVSVTALIGGFSDTLALEDPLGRGLGAELKRGEVLGVVLGKVLALGAELGAELGSELALGELGEALGPDSEMRWA